MRRGMQGLTLAISLLLSSGPVFAADEFSRGETAVTVGSNTITADNNVKYVNYAVGDPITVTLDYSAGCNIQFSGLLLRVPKAFTPPGVTGAISNVTGTPADADTSGNVTFDITFNSLKTAGQKQFGIAHLNLVLGVDDGCDGTIDGTTTIGVQISVSTASHP